MYPEETNIPSDDVETSFINDAKSKFATLQSEIAARNKRIADNDEYIYGDKLEHMLDIPIGHDFTPINWLRRTVEIHRAQFMGKGFAIDSSYQAEDIGDAGEDEEERARLVIENDKKKSYAEMRRKIVEAIIRDNGGDAFWSTAAENASAVGDTVIKAWFDEDAKKYTIQQIETVENFYALWGSNDYRQIDAVAYIYQVSKQEAIDKYNVSQDVQESPLGTPLAVLTQSNVQQDISKQPMVTIMEITGKIEGWGTDGKGKLQRVKIGKETEMNVICVGDVVYQIIDEEKMLPKHYILPNKHARRRPWGIPDVSPASIQINLTYIEALSDWRTLASKSNFPKFKGFGFSLGVQPPKPKPRTVEILPLAEGQDIQPIAMSQAAIAGEQDFKNQLEEMENQFVREVGISRQLFDLPDGPSNSNPAAITAMKSVSDITNAKRELWEPILRNIFEDALKKLSFYDDGIKEIVEEDDDWFIKVSWPSALNADDPSYHAMLLNQFNTGLLSIQSFLEKVGYDKQEADRIREEMEDPVLASIHGHILAQLAQAKIAPPGPAQPEVKVSLRGNLSPEQEANIAVQRGFNDGPFGPTATAQGNSGLTAQDNVDNAPYIRGAEPRGGEAISRDPQGNEVPPNGNEPELINNGTAKGDGKGIMSQPGSGAPMTSATGKMGQMNQRQGG